MNTSADPFADFVEPSPQAEKSLYPYQEGKAIAKVSYSHDAMIDMLIANPRISQGELANYFGYTQPWISLVMSSDAFKARLAARREELIDPAIRLSIEERFHAVVTRSQEVLLAKLSQPANQVSDNLALRAMELGAKALGLGTGQQAAPSVPAADHLASLAHRLIDLQQSARAQVYEAEAINAP